MSFLQITANIGIIFVGNSMMVVVADKNDVKGLALNYS